MNVLLVFFFNKYDLERGHALRKREPHWEVVVVLLLYDLERGHAWHGFTT